MVLTGLSLTRLAHDGGRWHTEVVDTSATVALCRCGTSTTMPLCDRTDPTVACFDGEEDADGVQPGPFTWDVPDPAGPPAAAIKPDGPLRVAGDVTIVYGEATKRGRDRWSLCRCGASRCQPVCDSSHKVVGFQG
jgi:CDGSH-type Zn-finger protein